MTRDERVGNCEICGLPMLVRHPLHFFCSDECRDRSLEGTWYPLPVAEQMARVIAAAHAYWSMTGSRNVMFRELAALDALTTPEAAS